MIVVFNIQFLNLFLSILTCEKNCVKNSGAFLSQGQLETSRIERESVGTPALSCFLRSLSGLSCKF